MHRKVPVLPVIPAPAGSFSREEVLYSVGSCPTFTVSQLTRKPRARSSCERASIHQSLTLPVQVLYLYHLAMSNAIELQMEAEASAVQARQGVAKSQKT